MSSNQSFVASLDDNGISDYWRLCDDLTLKQAALLILGIDPDSETGFYCEGWKPHERPAGYGAVKQALINSLSLCIKGKHHGMEDTDMNGNYIGDIPGTTDIDRSTVNRASVADWLRGRGVRTGFFFPNVNSNAPDFLDSSNARYAPKLAAAAQAWQAVTDLAPGLRIP